jgi:hypothetical protein
MSSSRQVAWRATRRTIVIAACIAVVSAALPPRTATADGSEWRPPVPGAVVRPFSEPVNGFAAGHRGVDFAAASGTPVLAANDGTVSFAGNVAGALHVVVAHAGGIRTSYSFLLRVDVAIGQHVHRGQVLGAAGGSGDGHGPGVFHFGVRIGDRYVDPMLLFRPTDLTALVRLVPAGERAAAGRASPEKERREIELFHSDGDGSCLGGLPFGDEICDAGSAIGEAAGDTGEAIGEAAADVYDWTSEKAAAAFNAGLQFARSLAGKVGAYFVENAKAFVAAFDELRKLVPELLKFALETNPIARIVGDLLAIGRSIVEHLFSCPQPDPDPHPAKLDNLVVAVGGLGSSRRRRKNGSVTASFDLEWQVYGYSRNNVEYFSYDANSETYNAQDTTEDLHEKARMLGEQIKEAARTRPGKPVDLIGHSQGGVVIAIFLQEIYRGHESEYPPIEHVVTLASPLRGTPTADVAISARHHPIAGFLARRATDAFHAGGESMEQLSEHSKTAHDLWKKSVPHGVQFLSIGGMEDWFIPSPSTEVGDGGTSIVVATGDLIGAHQAIERDSDQLGATQGFLHGHAPAPCGPAAGAPGQALTLLYRHITADLQQPFGVTPRLGP